ncbi:flagellin, partial [Heyndrickxia coagulans]
TVTDGTNNTAEEYALDVSSADNASKAITTIDNAIKKVSTERANLGAFENRLDHTVNNLTTSSENLTSAESRIRDVDMAKEMSEQTKDSILAQAAQAMLAQANQQPQQVLQLLR